MYHHPSRSIICLMLATTSRLATTHLNECIYMYTHIISYHIYLLIHHENQACTSKDTFKKRDFFSIQKKWGRFVQGSTRSFQMERVGLGTSTRSTLFRSSSRSFLSYFLRGRTTGRDTWVVVVDCWSLDCWKDQPPKHGGWKELGTLRRWSGLFGWWQLKYCLFSPRKLGKMKPF